MTVAKTARRAVRKAEKAQKLRRRAWVARLRARGMCRRCAERLAK